MRAADALPRVHLPGSARASWSLHLQRPWIPALAIFGSLIQLLLASYFGGAVLDPGSLARSFAAPPLDVYSVLRIAGESRLIVPALFVLRIGVVTGLVTAIVGRRLRFLNLLKVGALGLGSLLTAGLPIVLGLAYLTYKTRAVEAGQLTLVQPILLLGQAILLLLLVRFLSPMVCRAATGMSVRPVLTDGRLWIYSAVSGWLWMFTWQRATVFALGFVIVFAQSVLLGAIAIRSTQRIDEPMSA